MKTEKKRVDPKWFAIKAIWLSIAMWLIFKLVFSAFGERYSFMYDDQDIRCIPEYKAYLLKKNEPIVKGNIYAFRTKGLEPIFKDGTQLGKYIVATKDDYVVINEQGVSVNGEIIVTGFADAEKLGKKPSDYYKNFTVPENKAFFVGTAQRSYDSRYYGLVDYSQITGEAIPLW